MTTKQKGLLTLNMIVKDEAKTIGRTLASVKPILDRWIIADTGSTDGTKDEVRRVMAGVPGEIVDIPFTDFAATRNASLDACGDETEFILILDAEDELRAGDKLRSFLERERASRGPDHEAYYVRVHAGTWFSSARVLRSAAGWRYQGAVHEVLTRPDRVAIPAIRIPDAQILHNRADHSTERTRARWERDRGLLEAALAKNPNDSRSAFYLGQTYMGLGRIEQSIAAYQRRVAMGGWIEEVYLAKMAIAHLAETAERAWPEVLDLYLDAFATCPHRAEPLFEIARRYNALAQHPLAVLFARRGLDLSYPKQDQSFVDEDVYTWKLADVMASSAFWVGEYERGEAAARQALRYRPEDERMKQNLRFYVERKIAQRRKSGG